MISFQKQSCNGQSTALKREANKERLGLIKLKNGQSLSVSTLLRAYERREQWRTVCSDASALTPLRPTDRVMDLW
jgi:hypothetical protein